MNLWAGPGAFNVVFLHGVFIILGYYHPGNLRTGAPRCFAAWLRQNFARPLRVKYTMNILIEGDSWAYTFTFDDSTGSYQHPGFSQYLQPHCCIVNAQPGSSNQLSISRIRGYTQAVDLIIWIQTEPIRDFFTDQFAVNSAGTSRAILDYRQVVGKVMQHGSLHSAMRDHLKTSTYSQLNQAAQEKSAQVLLLGGCSPVQTDLLEGLDNLHCLIPSIPGMFLPDCEYQTCLFQNTHQWANTEYADFVVATGRARLIQDWFAETKNINEKLLSWTQDQTYFNPDKWHVNDLAHRKIADIILDHLKR